MNPQLILPDNCLITDTTFLFRLILIFLRRDVQTISQSIGLAHNSAEIQAFSSHPENNPSDEVPTNPSALVLI